MLFWRANCVLYFFFPWASSFSRGGVSLLFQFQSDGATINRVGVIWLMAVKYIGLDFFFVSYMCIYVEWVDLYVFCFPVVFISDASLTWVNLEIGAVWLIEIERESFVWLTNDKIFLGIWIPKFFGGNISSSSLDPSKMGTSASLTLNIPARRWLSGRTRRSEAMICQAYNRFM